MHQTAELCVEKRRELSRFSAAVSLLMTAIMFVTQDNFDFALQQYCEF